MCFFRKKKAESSETMNGSVSSLPEEASKRVSIHLQSVNGGNKIKIIKIVQRLTKEALPRAKELVESAPTVIASNVPFMDAQSIKLELERAGATVSLTQNI